MKCKMIVLLYLVGALSLSAQKTFLVFGGKTGWIGQKLVKIIAEQGHCAIAARSRLENRSDIEQEIAEVKPDFIINAAGITGVPNIDWIEEHKQETIRANIIGALNLADIAYIHSIHMTNIGTGCIYSYDMLHPMGSGKGFTEEDESNFEGSFYSKSKAMLEKMLRCYPNVLYLRLRLPLAYDFHKRNLIAKLTTYQKVVNIPNSITVLDELLPLVPQMALRGRTGVYNFVNPGVISHNELLDLYKEYVDPSFNYKNFTLEEQDKILKAKRSNNELDTSKLQQEFPNMRDVKQATVEVFRKMKKSCNP
jgi:3,5-epimerase/4-reductase